MNAISASFGFRTGQGASLPSAQQAQAQRGSVVNTFNSGAGAARGNANATSMSAGRSSAGATSAAFCPGCGVGGNARGGASGSSSFCPTCNQAGGRQSSITNFNANANFNANTATRTGAAQTGAAHTHQGGRICVGCAYQGR